MACDAFDRIWLDRLSRVRLSALVHILIFIFIPIVMLRWTFPNSFGDSRIGPLRNLCLEVDHVNLVPPIISEVKPVAKGVPNL